MAFCEQEHRQDCQNLTRASQGIFREYILVMMTEKTFQSMFLIWARTNQIFGEFKTAGGEVVGVVKLCWVSGKTMTAIEHFFQLKNAFFKQILDLEQNGALTVSEHSSNFWWNVSPQSETRHLVLWWDKQSSILRVRKKKFWKNSFL